MGKSKKSLKPRLYLDIDGVLNSTVGDQIAKKKFPEDMNLLAENLLAHKYLLYKHWHEPSVNALRHVLETIKPEIYIHSTWKNHFELEDFTTFFNHWNLDASLIKGIVPRYKFSSERYHDLSWHIGGDRIGDDDTIACHNYVVLDDIDMTYVFEERDVFKTRQLVCNPEVGFTQEQAEQAIALFKKNSTES